jgi:hypothetical protein
MPLAPDMEPLPSGALLFKGVFGHISFASVMMQHLCTV